MGPFGERPFGFAGFGPVAGKDFWMRFLDHGKLLVDGAGDSEMEFLAAALEQRLVSRIPNERVLELVGGIRCYPTHIKQFGISQAAQRPQEIRFVYRMNRVSNTLNEAIT